MRVVASFLVLCLDYAWLVQGMGMLSLNQQRLVSKFLSSRQEEAPEITLMPAKQRHDDVEAEVAMERSQFTETGQSMREKELLTNIGRLEDQLEGYRRLGPNLHQHIEMQESTKKTLQALEAKTMRIEAATATLWWDSKMLLSVVMIFGAALCIYVSCLHARQNSQQARPRTASGKFDAAAPKDAAECEYFNLAEDTSGGMTPEDWWVQPCGHRSAPLGVCPDCSPHTEVNI